MTAKTIVNVHAGCVVLAHAATRFGARRDSGVLILGRSGAGKSDLALRLIERGAILVSDDRTDLLLVGGSLVARAPANLRGLIEVRGLGIVALPFAPKARVVLAVSLEGAAARLPPRESYKAPWPLSHPLPLLRLPAFDPSTPAKVVLAAAAFERNLFRETAGAHST